MPKTQKKHRRKTKKGGNGKQSTTKVSSSKSIPNSANLTVMKNGKVLNFSKVPKNTEKVFVGEPWSAKNAIKRADNFSKIEKSPNYYNLNNRLGDPQQFLVSSHIEKTPAIVTGPHGYLHDHTHFHPHSKDHLVGGKRKKRKTRHKKGKKHRKKHTRKNKMRGGFGKSRFFPGLVNVFRNLENTGENIVRGFMGYPALISPSPLEQPINSTICPPPNIPPNVESLYSIAQDKVLAI